MKGEVLVFCRESDREYLLSLILEREKFSKSVDGFRKLVGGHLPRIELFTLLIINVEGLAFGRYDGTDQLVEEANRLCVEEGTFVLIICEEPKESYHLGNLGFGGRNSPRSRQKICPFSYGPITAALREFFSQRQRERVRSYHYH